MKRTENYVPMDRCLLFALLAAWMVFPSIAGYVCDKAIDTIGLDGPVTVREFYPDTDPTGGLFETNECPLLKLTVKGNGAVPVKVAYVCDLTDIAGNTTRDVAEGALEILPGERTFDVVLPPQPHFGHFTVTLRMKDASGRDLGYSQTAFIVPAGEPVRRDPFFKLDANNGCEKIYPAGRRLGFGGLGVKIPSAQVICHASDDRLEAYLDNLRPDRRTGRLAIADYELSVHVSQSFDTPEYYPEFADLRLLAHEHVTNRLAQSAYIITDADLAKIRRFYRRAAQLLSDRVGVWYIQGEFDSNGRRRRMNGQWVHHLSTTALVSRNLAQAIRAGNPRATIAVLGICCGDYFLSPQPFLYSRMVLDSMRGEFDAVALDAYTGNYDVTHGALTPPEESLARLLADGAELSAEYGGRKEVWIAERGLGVDYYSAFDSQIDRRAMDETARALIIAKAVSECRDYSLHLPSSRSCIYAERANKLRPKPTLDMSLWRTTNIDVSPTNLPNEHHTPRAFLLAASGCARMLAFAHTPRTFGLGDCMEMRSFLVPFAGGEVARIALWTTGGALVAEATLPVHGTLTDLAGNEQPLATGMTTFVVSRTPQFLTFAASAREAAEVAVRGFKVVSRENPKAARSVTASRGSFAGEPLALDVAGNIYPRTVLMPEHGFFPMKDEPSAALRFAYTEKGLEAEVVFAGETTHEDCEIQLLRGDEVSAYYGQLSRPVRMALAKTDSDKVFRGVVAWAELRSRPIPGQRFWFTARLPCRPTGHVGPAPFALVNREPRKVFLECATELILK